MLQPVRLSRCFVRRSVTLAAILPALLASAGVAPAGEVVVHDRGRKIVLQDKDAADIEGICIELMRRARGRTGAISTDEMRFIRASEVAVEIHYDAPRELELGWTNERARAQHLFVPLTGAYTGADGNSAEVFVGRTAAANEPRYLGIEYYNAPDAQGVQYGGAQDAPGQLQELRDRVAQLGVDAPRPTPRPQPTPNLTPLGKD